MTATYGPLVITAKDSANPQATASLSSFSIIVNKAPTPSFSVAPSITTDGSPNPGETFVGNDGTYANGSVVSRQWFINGTAVPNETTNTYTALNADMNDVLTYQVNLLGDGGTATSTSAGITIGSVSLAVPAAAAGKSLVFNYEFDNVPVVRDESTGALGTWQDYYWYGYPYQIGAHDDYADNTMTSYHWSQDIMNTAANSVLSMRADDIANSTFGPGSSKYATFTAGATISGTSLVTDPDAHGNIVYGVRVGQYVTGTGVLAGTRITGGSAPNWTINNSQTLSDRTLTFQRAGIGSILHTAPNYNDFNANPTVFNNSGYQFLYGYAEARIRTPNVTGYWPAFWLYTQTNTGQANAAQLELDIAEFNTDGLDYVYSTLHVHDYGIYTSANGKARNSTGNQIKMSSHGFTTTDNWHIYGCLWTSTSFKIYIDQVLVMTIPHTEFTIPMFLIVTNGLGTFDNNYNYPSAGNFGKTFDVDWIRVWQ